MSLNSTHTRFSAGDEPVDRVFASSPEGLVATGDALAMRRYLLLHPTGEKQDGAKDALLSAGTKALACTKDQRVFHMRLMGWPVSISHNRMAKVPSTLSLGHQKERHLVLKMRELWSRALGAAHGTLVCPMSVATHVHSLLSISPNLLHDCTQHGVALLSGREVAKAFSFDTAGSRLEDASPRVPSAFVFGAYVCWDYGRDEPDLQMPQDVAFEMQQLVQGLFSTGNDSVGTVMIGKPCAFPDSISVAHGLQIAAMKRYAHRCRQDLDLDLSQQDDVLRMSAKYLDHDDEEPAYTFSWEYNAMWRSSQHLTTVSEVAEDETRALDGRYRKAELNLDSVPPISRVQVH